MEDTFRLQNLDAAFKSPELRTEKETTADLFASGQQ